MLLTPVTTVGAGREQGRPQKSLDSQIEIPRKVGSTFPLMGAVERTLG